MYLHSTLDGRAGDFRVRGAVWEVNSLTFRGFLYVIPLRSRGTGRHRVLEAEGADVWELLAALTQQVSSTCGAEIKRLDARAVGATKPAATARRALPLEGH